jgi:hypothetical protein
MHALGVQPGPRQPQAQGRVGMSQEELHFGGGQAEIEGQQGLGDRVGGGAQAIERGTPATGKAGLAGLAFQLLDTVPATIADQSVKGRLRIAAIITGRIGAGVASGAHALGGAAPTFAGRPGFDARLAHVPQQWGRVWAPAERAIVGRAGLQDPGRFGSGRL